jgi:hypothetical protein
MGLTLISIPFWWDKSSNSLASTIESARPDIKISASTSKPSSISPYMPIKYQRQIKYTPNVSLDFKGQVDPTGW